MASTVVAIILADTVVSAYVVMQASSPVVKPARARLAFPRTDFLMLSQIPSGLEYPGFAQNAIQPTRAGSCRQPLPTQKSGHGSIAKDCQGFVIANAPSLRHDRVAGGVQGAGEDRLVGKSVANEKLACFDVCLRSVSRHALGRGRDKWRVW